VALKQEDRMRKKRHSAEQIVKKLRTAEIEMARGLTVKQACKKIEVTEQTYCTATRPSFAPVLSLGRGNSVAAPRSTEAQ
jgi:hypothetical protein